MTMSMFGSLIGGIGLFLLGMKMMTDGLRYAAGASLRNILERSTRTPFLGICTGAFLTSLVQSSSAVTVATIGFVNAGLVDLGHAVSLIYGTNIGTTATGWLVSMIGFKVNLKIFALPAIGVGMFLRVVYSEGRYGSVGEALAGFGIFFVGIDVLKTAFGSMGNNLQMAGLAWEGVGAILLFVGIGFVLTFLMQSSSAAIAIILTAVAGGVVPLTFAAVAVIGANVGTTSTAALSVIGATPNAKRLAGAHVLFNIVTGLVALLALPFLLTGLQGLQKGIGMDDSPIILLALFHTTFNLLGVILLYPFSKRLVVFLKKRFRTAEEDESRPKFLDRNVLVTPALALHALEMELKRTGVIARRMAKGAISTETVPGKRLALDKVVIDKLNRAIGEFGKEMQQKNLPVELANQLPNALRVAGYHRDMAQLAIDLARFQSEPGHVVSHPGIIVELTRYKSNAVKLLRKVNVELEEYSAEACKDELEDVKDEYRVIKNNLLQAATRGEISVRKTAHCLDIIARIRRIAEQAEKGARYLAYLTEMEENMLNDSDEEDRESEKDLQGK
ncbi:MAG: Na/Pi cotransporter family protein [Desulfobulbaceae bacterium]|uniref:Na/Pi cotransporter family protein n=1 Tax=Candidatus Desulfobia pelagia TaxID=2841692 RepID=A0A8J6NEY3_9BACT|nr:Na/Pi cotransporter family protein [Candidatus Desulfobia pelagia]